MREPDYGEPLSNPQIEHFLEEESVGTLAIDAGQRSSPYNIPMSFGFSEFHPPVFQFVVHPDSEKMEYVDEGTRATLTVLDHRTGGWVSAMIRGSLSHVTEDEREQAAAVFERSTGNQTVSVFEERDDYRVEYWSLEPERMTGRWSGQHSVLPAFGTNRSTS